MALAAGTHLGPHEILSLIGAGGMSKEFLTLRPLTKATPTPITVVVNWTTSLQK